MKIKTYEHSFYIQMEQLPNISDSAYQQLLVSRSIVTLLDSTDFQISTTIQ